MSFPSFIIIMTAALLLLFFVFVSIQVAALALQGFALALDFSPLFGQRFAFGFEVVRHYGVGLRAARPASRAGAFFRQANPNFAGCSSGLAALRALSLQQCGAQLSLIDALWAIRPVYR